MRFERIIYLMRTERIFYSCLAGISLIAFVLIITITVRMTRDLADIRHMLAEDRSSLEDGRLRIGPSIRDLSEQSRELEDKIDAFLRQQRDERARTVH